MPFPSSRDLPGSGTEHTSPASSALAGGFFTTSITWEAEHFTWKEEYSTLNQIILLSKCTEYEHLAHQFSSVQFSHSVVSDSLLPHGPHSMPGLPVHHQLPEFTQTHVH